MLPALSQICSLPATFERQIRDYAAGKCPAVELWLTKVEDYVSTHSVADVVRLLKESEILAPVASQQGGLLGSQGDRRREAWDLFARRLKWLVEMEVKTVVVSFDVPSPLSQVDMERACMSLAQVAEAARAADMRVAMEFMARSALGNNLQTAAALVRDVGSPHLGLCFDAFQYYVGPSKLSDLELLTRDNLFHVQLCDLADVPRELATDSHRILPGDGDIPLQPIVDRLNEIGYEGLISIELMNPQLWQVDPRQFGEIAITALRRLLGTASM